MQDYLDSNCHVNGNVRGLLCTSCNCGIGFLKDNVFNLENGIKYLIKHAKAKQLLI